ncbi:MAG: 2-oxoglutarate dehydrogenase E1 component, partial [Flavobacteriales bacterium]|nr:2-oxoglutarate dehydrogenase E1 component [Flavobacteriales bacterium]
MNAHTYLSNADPASFEELYKQYKKDPASVDISWQRFFEGFEFQHASFPVISGSSTLSGKGAEALEKEFRVINLINAYRQRGHLFTRTNPVRERRKHIPPLDKELFGLQEADLNTTFQAGNEVGL